MGHCSSKKPIYHSTG